jgi:cytidine deaminase
MNMSTTDALKPSDRDRLIAASITARQLAHAPYSRFLVGAALLTDDGQIVSGANVENASYGLTVCAERVAVQSAVTTGRASFRAIAVATSGGGSPCGACRQVLAEFCDDLLILLIDVDREYAVTEARLAELLPRSFRLQD